MKDQDPVNYGMPENWTPLETAPVIPGQASGGAPPLQSSAPGPYFSGSISPSLQHDAQYVKTGYASGSVEAVSLMPVALGGVASNNAGVQTIVKIGTSSSLTPPGGTDTDVQINRQGLFYGDGGFTYNPASGLVTIGGALTVGGALNITGSIILGGSLTVTGFISSTTGFQVNGAASTGHVLRGNGTNFVDAALAASDLSNGVTGSGAVVLAGSPTLTGAPLSTTPATADNSTKIATTAYVQNQGYVTAATAPVVSVFGRAGAVVAVANDYSFSQISGLISPAQTVSASVNRTAQTGNVGATTLFSVGSSGAGLYRISIYLVVSQTATVSSTLPDSRIIFTDQDSSTTVTTAVTSSQTGNLLTTVSEDTFIVNAKASTIIQYDIGQVTPYTSVGATPMQFAYRARVEYLG